jgi:phospholipid/cholesterol/gamma-HCH transport system ATP-binding protein
LALELTKPDAPKDPLDNLEPVANLTDVHLSLGGQDILKGLTLALYPGSKTAILGESSCGKSVILKTMVGLFRPQKGEVHLFGQNLANISTRAITVLRRRIGMQFQAGALFDSSTTRLNLVMASLMSAHGSQMRGHRASDAEILDLLSQVGLAGAADVYPASLSGGMRKRVALARALIGQPELAIFDEPTAGLDPQTSSRIINLLNSLAQNSQAAMILATTDPDVARRFAERIILIQKGQVHATGSITELKALGDPYVDRYLQRLVAV